MTGKLGGAMTIRAYAFDAYGTLFNVAGAALRHGETLGVDAESFAALWRQKQVEYSWTLTLMGRYHDFWELTQRALDYAYEKFPAADRSLREAMLGSYWTLDAFADTKISIERLKQDGMRMVVFTNGTGPMARAAADHAGITHLFENVVSIDAIGRFKTAPETYQLACRTLDLPLGDVALVSSNRWDIAGARSAGMRAIWCNRTNQPNEYADLAPERVIFSLNDL